MLKLIREMIEDDIKKEKEMLKEAVEKKQQVKEKLQKEGKPETERIIGWDGRFYTKVNSELEEVINKYKYYLKLKAQYGMNGAEERIEKDILEHYKMLQQKVEKEIGKIVEVERLGGFDYNFIGETKSCGVRVVLAGGYNVQRKHTRWVITRTDY